MGVLRWSMVRLRYEIVAINEILILGSGSRTVVWQDVRLGPIPCAPIPTDIDDDVFAVMRRLDPENARNARR